MAKGQQRSNREAKKPKQDKKPAPVENAFSSQFKNAEHGMNVKKQPKK